MALKNYKEIPIGPNAKGGSSKDFNTGVSHPLSLAIVFLAQYTALPFLNTTPKINLSAKKQAPITQEEKPAVAQSPSLSDFLTIADQNLFHPDRTTPVQKVSVPLPDIILYGVSITDSESVAYVEDKKSQRTTTGRGKRQTVLRKGNTIGGFTLKEIEPDRIELVKGDAVVTAPGRVAVGDEQIAARAIIVPNVPICATWSSPYFCFVYAIISSRRLSAISISISGAFGRSGFRNRSNGNL